MPTIIPITDFAAPADWTEEQKSRLATVNQIDGAGLEKIIGRA